MRKKINIVKPNFDRFDFFFLIIILLVFFARLPIPDSSFDTLNYHLYLQERVFSNNVSFNFFPARWINTFSLPLSDRLHYFFRYLLGYRLGIICNLFIMIVIYYQLKEILKNFIDNKKYVSLMSCIILITEQLLSNMITYYVDLMSIPLILEIVIILLNNKKVDNIINFLILFISGSLVSLKVSNAFFLIPFAIIYIIRYYKFINFKTFLFGIPIFAFPLIIYLLNNYLQTGNPVFPFYNSIFKSNYLSNTNWIEDFYGPKNLLERLLWPVYLFKYPRRAFDTNIYYGRIGFGYIVSLFVVFKSLFVHFFKHEKKSLFSNFCIMFLLLCLIWSNFMMGYIRYALVLEVLSGIILMVFIYKNIYSKNFLNFFVVLFCMYGSIYTFVFSMSDMLHGTNENSWRYPYSLDKIGYNNNINYLFNRRWNYDNIVGNVDCFGIVDYNAGYASLLSTKAKIISLNEGYNSDYGKEKSINLIKECKNIYTISTSATLDRTQKYLDKVGYKQIGEIISFKTDFINYNNDMIIFEIKEKK